jgi:hypothetical protein
VADIEKARKETAEAVAQRRAKEREEDQKNASVALHQPAKGKYKVIVIYLL